MVKVQIKSEQITPFGGIFSIMEQFDALLSKVIDSTFEKHGQSADDCVYKKLLQNDYQKNERKGIRTTYNESYQDFRLQIHFRPGQMD